MMKYNLKCVTIEILPVHIHLIKYSLGVILPVFKSLSLNIPKSIMTAVYYLKGLSYLSI